MHCIKKTLTGANPIEIIAGNQLITGLTTMKFLLFIAFAAGLLALERPIIFGETFTEGTRVSPERDRSEEDERPSSGSGKGDRRKSGRGLPRSRLMRPDQRGRALLI
jgi:hypothetical protein